MSNKQYFDTTTLPSFYQGLEMHRFCEFKPIVTYSILLTCPDCLLPAGGVKSSRLYGWRRSVRSPGPIEFRSIASQRACARRKSQQLSCLVEGVIVLLAEKPGSLRNPSIFMQNVDFSLPGEPSFQQQRSVDVHVKQQRSDCDGRTRNHSSALRYQDLPI